MFDGPRWMSRNPNRESLELERQHADLKAAWQQITHEPDERLAECLTRLLAAFEAHFAEEEALMLDTAAPGMDSHIQEHRQTASGLRDLVRAAEAGRYDAVRRAVTNWLSQWYVVHHASLDHALQLWLERCTASASAQAAEPEAADAA
ncbi:MAG: hypothetical protein EAZ99_17725 [Alphaproteobacteria bacterium]|nr:MAG: hypothetical protein EAZ99_17725 [Alphaproteobacteria bacterium]